MGIAAPEDDAVRDCRRACHRSRAMGEGAGVPNVESAVVTATRERLCAIIVMRMMERKELEQGFEELGLVAWSDPAACLTTERHFSDKYPTSAVSLV